MINNWGGRGVKKGPEGFLDLPIPQKFGNLGRKKLGKWQEMEELIAKLHLK